MITTSAATIAAMTPQDAYQLGVLDERLRAAEQAREELVMNLMQPKPKPPAKPKAPKTPETAPVNGDAAVAGVNAMLEQNGEQPAP